MFAIISSISQLRPMALPSQGQGLSPSAFQMSPRTQNAAKVEELASDASVKTPSAASQAFIPLQVCMACLCVCACMCVVYMCVDMCVYVCMNVCVCKYMCVYVSECTCVCVCCLSQLFIFVQYNAS